MDNCGNLWQLRFDWGQTLMKMVIKIFWLLDYVNLCICPRVMLWCELVEPLLLPNLLSWFYVNLAKVTRTKRTKILLELTPEIINLKFTRTENDPYQTELDPNIFCLNYFSFQEKPIGPKISWPEVDLNWKWSNLKPNPNRITLTRKWPDSMLTRTERPIFQV